MCREYKTFFSPAKINLFFKVVSKRNDGYHEIASLYQAIDLCDIFKIKISERKNSFSCDGMDLSFTKDNLIFIAYEKFKEKSGLNFFVDIHLIKNIPAEAGLGGGSSNAATMLWALNELCNFPLSIDELKNIGTEIGSDISFFLSKGLAYCTGRGEVLKDVDSYHPFTCYIIKPPFGMSTKGVYSNVDIEQLKGGDEKNHIKALESYLRGEIICFNDLEKPAYKISPQLFDFKTKMQQKNLSDIYLTGSGSSFFFFGNHLKLDENLGKTKIFKVKSMLREKGLWYSKN